MKKRNPIVKTITSSVFAFALAVSSLASVDFASAAGGTAIWTGTAGDGKFSTATNWAGDALPVDGDELIFKTELPTNANNAVLTNDLTDVEFSKVTADDTGHDSVSNYSITGNVTILQDGASLKKIGTFVDVNFSSGIQGNGSLTLNNWSLYDSTNISGSLSTNADGSYANGIIGGVNGIKGVTSLAFAGSNSFTVDDNISFPITVQPNAFVDLYFSGKCAVMTSGGGCSNWKSISRTVSGDLSLAANINVSVAPDVTVKFTGSKTGSGSVIRNASSDYRGILIVGGKKLVNPTKTTKLNGKTTDSVAVVDKETAILNGERGSATVYGGGLLKGNGTVDNLQVYDGGTIAPGNSPGKITVKQNLWLAQNSTFNAEILNKDKYDQLVVAGTVDIANAKLDLKFIKGGTVKKGDEFILISNGGSDAVAGTFAGLKEGAKITIGKAVFAISYKGGSNKNDVVLTALTTAVAPGTPNTGFHIDRANPMIVALLGILTVALLITVAARRKSTQK